MSLHKLTAGDGYTYLTRQVAALDGDERGRTSLESYYSEKGERPGVWHGRGAEALGVAGLVSEDQMRALFGEGRHPNADAIEAQLAAEGKTPQAAMAATKLGRAFPMYESPNGLRTRVAQAIQEWNMERGERAGAEAPDHVREEIRTREARIMFADEHGRPARDARELSGFIARQSRPEKIATAGYDLTFTPVKSFSVLWALAPLELADKLESIHNRAVDHALAFLEREAALTRQGAQGVRQVETNGLLIARFTHRDNRAGEANLHTHATVSNKVQVRTDDGTQGQWLALDGRMMHRLAVAGSEQYNAFVERLSTEELSASFVDREPRGGTGRPVREIEGVDPALCEINSSRSAAIEVGQSELALRFQRDHGRAPTPMEAIRLAQTATLDTRQAKHEPRSYLEQRTDWRLRADAAIGSQQVAAMVAAFAERPAAPGFRLDPAEVARVVAGVRDDVLAVVADSRAQWQMQHVMAEAARQVTRLGLPVDVAAEIELAVLAACKEPSAVVPIGPVDPPSADGLVRSGTGESQYTVHLAQTYTSTAVVDAEQRIVAAAGRADGRVVPAAAVDIAMLTMAANGIVLNPGQAGLVREMATSGARVQLALAPAGTGKTTAMQALSDAWREDGGTVIGLAPSAAAAVQLGKATGGDTDTIDQLMFRAGIGYDLPQWAQDLGPASLVIVDEAGMASTAQLDCLIGFAVERGASVRLIGDDQQLASVSAGGVLRDVQSEHGALTLTEVVRFSDPAEGPASLALRAGDAASVAFYLDNDRVHIGDFAGVVDKAFMAWSADAAAGVDAVLMTPTRSLTAQLNERARADRIQDLMPAQVGREVTLPGGQAASSGDIILTTKNKRALKMQGTDFVRNGYRWRIDEVNADGSLRVTHLQQGVSRTLPAWYLQEGNVALGYAATVHAKQGITATKGHYIVDPNSTRQLLYVGLSRGEQENHAYVPVVGAGDEHSLPHADTINPQTGGEVLAAVIGRDGSQVSATTANRRAWDPRVRLTFEAQRYSDSLRHAAERVLGEAKLDQLTELLETTVPGVTAAPAWPTLRGHLALIALAGTDPASAALAAIGRRELGTALDVAALIDWRLNPVTAGLPAGPLPWLYGVPAVLAADPKWGPVLSARGQQVGELSAAVETLARGWVPGGTDVPLWAAPLVEAGAHPKLLAQTAVWRAAQGVDDRDRRVAGPPARSIAERAIHRRLTQGAQAFMQDRTEGGRRWFDLAQAIDPRLVDDPHWPLLAARLDLAQQAGIDAAALATAVAAHHPLPDEQPAAALWWRLQRHLNHTAAATDSATAGQAQRPEWRETLDRLLGEDQAVVVLTDPMWPSLAATLDRAGATGADPDALLREVAAAVAGAVDIAPTDLATAMLWRVSVLTDPEPLDELASLPPDPEQEANARPADLDDALPAVAEPEDLQQPDPVNDWDIDHWQPNTDDLAYAQAEPDRDPSPTRPTQDWGDVLAQRPLPHSDLDPDSRVDAIAADIEVARHQLAAQDAAISANRSPAVVAAMPMLLDMRARADELTPLAANAAYARENWLEAQQFAEQWAADARRGGPEADGADVLASGAASYAAQLRTDYHTARSALESAAGGPEHVTTHADADQVMFIARGLDLDRSAQLRRDLIVLQSDYTRAEIAAARTARPTEAERELLHAVPSTPGLTAATADQARQARTQPARPEQATAGPRRRDGRSAALDRRPAPSERQEPHRTIENEIPGRDGPEIGR